VLKEDTNDIARIGRKGQGIRESDRKGERSGRSSHTEGRESWNGKKS
jgi:hypothetical protein